MKSFLPNQTRIPELDGLRGMAIALVLFAHDIYDGIVPGTSRFGDFIRHTFTLGGTGVDLFFVLSGFLIGGILLDNRGKDNYFKSFYIRRVCRILPLYYSLLILFVIARWLFSSYSSQGWYKLQFVSGVSIWTYFTFTQNIFETIRYLTAQVVAGWLWPTWSLAVEEQFYLLLPLVIWLARPSWWLPAFVGCICVHQSFYLFMWLYHPISYLYLNFLVPSRGDALLLGAICAYLIRRRTSLGWLKRNRDWLYVLCGVLFSGAVYLAINFKGDDLLGGDFPYSWMALLYACALIIAVTEENGVISSFLRLSPLRKLGIIAYSAFLLHQPINGLLHGLVSGNDGYQMKNFSDTLATIIALVATLALATISWRFFEKPIIAWSHSFIYGNRKDTTPEVITAAAPLDGVGTDEKNPGS